MITLSPTQQAVLAQNARGVVWLVEMQFLSGTQYKTTHSAPIVYAGNTYGALGQVMTISNVSESGTIKTDRLKVRLSITDEAVLAFLIGPASEYRNRRIKLYAQFIGSEWQPVGDAIKRWSGFMDKLSVSRTSNPQGESGGFIEMTCVRAGIAKFRSDSGLRLSHAQQQLEYPGDMGLEYTESLVNNPVVWLSKEFQKV